MWQTKHCTILQEWAFRVYSYCLVLLYFVNTFLRTKYTFIFYFAQQAFKLINKGFAVALVLYCYIIKEFWVFCNQIWQIQFHPALYRQYNEYIIIAIPSTNIIWFKSSFNFKNYFLRFKNLFVIVIIYSWVRVVRMGNVSEPEFTHMYSNIDMAKSIPFNRLHTTTGVHTWGE